MIRKGLNIMEPKKKNNNGKSKIQETELEEISGGSFVEDINTIDLFQPAPKQMENTSWMADITFHGSRN